MERVFLHSQTTQPTSSNVNDVLITAEDRESDEDPEVFVNEPCIVIWDTSNGRQWYVGICLSDNGDGNYTVEHLERSDKNQSKLWKHKHHQDIQTVNTVQIIPTNIVGSWDMEKRTMIFNLENWEMIDILFRSFY